jgi:hypothetical protein
MAYTDYLDRVQEIYIGYYQRPADPEGLLYWAARLDAVNGNLDAIIEAFANSPESQALYPNISEATIDSVINQIYQSFFDRDADAAGLAFYHNGFVAGTFTAGTIMLNVLDGAINQDAVIVANKLTAAERFTTTIDPELDGRELLATYSGETDAQAARDWLAQIGYSPATIPDQNETTNFVQQYIADPGDPILAASPISLTTGIDNVLGTGAGELILGYVANTDSTLQNFDTMNGLGGYDNLVISYDDSESISLTSQNVEEITFRPISDGADIYIDMGNSSGFTNLSLASAPAYSTSVELFNIDSELFTISAKNVAQSDYAYLDLTFTAAIGTGADDTLTLNLENAGNVNTGYYLSMNTFSSTASESDFVENVSIASAGNSNYLYLDDGFENVKTVAITGDGDMQLDSWLDFPNVTSFDASTASGDLLIESFSTELTAGTVDITLGSGNDYIYLENSSTGAMMVVNTGAGNDYVYQSSSTDIQLNTGDGNDFVIGYSSATDTVRAYDLGAGDDIFVDWGYMNYGDADTAEGGAGTDTIFAYSSSFTADMEGAVTGFEQLGIEDGGTYDLDFLPGIQTIVTGANEFLSGPSWLSDYTSTNLTGWTTDTVIDNAPTGLALIVGGDGDDSSFTINAATDGAANAITVTLAGTDDVTIGAGITDGLSLNDYESITINSTNADVDNTPNVNTIAYLDASDLSVLTITGENDLTINGIGTTAGNTANLTKIDASAATGDITFGDWSNTGNSVEFLGGAGNDTYNGTANGDAVNGGAGADDVNLDPGFASIDTVVVGAGDSVMNAGADGFDAITGFGTAAGLGALDIIDLGAFNFASGSLTSTLANKGVLVNDLVDGTTLDVANFFDFGGADRAVAIGTNGGNTYMFVDADQNGDYSAANDVVLELVGVTDVTSANVGF